MNEIITRQENVDNDDTMSLYCDSHCEGRVDMCENIWMILFNDVLLRQDFAVMIFVQNVHGYDMVAELGDEVLGVCSLL